MKQVNVHEAKTQLSRLLEEVEAGERMAWHHRDPFDRFLIAQALEEGSTIVTHDEVFAAYGVPVVRA